MNFPNMSSFLYYLRQGVPSSKHQIKGRKQFSYHVAACFLFSVSLEGFPSFLFFLFLFLLPFFPLSVFLGQWSSPVSHSPKCLLLFWTLFFGHSWLTKIIFMEYRCYWVHLIYTLLWPYLPSIHPSTHLLSKVVSPEEASFKGRRCEK